MVTTLRLAALSVGAWITVLANLVAVPLAAVLVSLKVCAAMSSCEPVVVPGVPLFPPGENNKPLVAVELEVDTPPLSQVTIFPLKFTFCWAGDQRETGLAGSRGVADQRPATRDPG